MAEARSHLGGMVVLTQSLHSFYSELSAQSGKHYADALLTNFGHKVVHAMGDPESASWASKLVGERLEVEVSGGGEAPDIYDLLTGGRPQGGPSFTRQMRPVVPPMQFMHGLRTGGRENGYLCDAYVVRSGEPFRSNGENVLLVPFRQR